MASPKKGHCDPDELVRLVRAGDVEAVDRMTRCYGAHLMSIARSYCAGEADAEDAVQDALLSASEHLEAYRGDGSVEGWLIRMVVNACRRMHRRRKNDSALHVGGATELLASEADSPERATLRAEVAEAIDRELSGLPTVDRAIFLLAEGAGWTGAEIARSIDLTPGAVRTRLSRTRARLRERLGATVPHVFA